MQTENRMSTEISFDELGEMIGFNLDDTPTPPKETPKQEQEEVNLEQEQEQEKVTPEIEKEPETEITFEQPSIHLALLKEKLETGEWEDVIIGDEENGIKLSEMENIDEDEYKQIIAEQKRLKDEDLKNNYIKVDGLSDIQKSLINIVKEGNLDKARELFENPQTLVEPFQGYDSDNEQHNEQVLAWYYQQQGNSPKEVEALLKIAKEDLTLDVKANKIVDWQREQYQTKIKAEEEKIQQQKLAEQENIKKFRKELVTELKSTVDENLAKKFADVATKYDKNGELDVDKTYDEWMRDPKKASELIHFLYDRDSFIKKLTSETKRNVQLDVAKKIHIIRSTAKTSDPTKSKSEEENNPFPDLVFE